MGCDDITDLLLAYIDGALPERRAEQIARHLQGCASCQQHHGAEVEMAAALDLPCEGLAGDGLMAAVMGDIEALPAHDQAPALVLHISPWARWALAPLLAAATIALLAWFAGAGFGGEGLAEHWAAGQEHARAWGGDLNGLALALRQTGQQAVDSSHQAFEQSSAGDSSLMKIVTALAALACAALVARFRHATKEQGA